LDRVVRLVDRAIPDHYADAGALLEVQSIEGERLDQHLEKTERHLLGLGGRGHAFGQVEEFVATETRQRVRGSGHHLETPGDPHQQLVSHEVAVSVVHSLEVIEVQQQHGSEPALANGLGVRVGEPILEQSPVGEPGERVVEGLMRELRRECPLIGDVALRGDEVERLSDASFAGVRDTSETITRPSLRR